MKCILATVIVLILWHDPNVAETKNDDQPSTLSFLFMITRHGARVPTLLVPGDPNIKFWKEERGQLTNIGKNEMYLLGQLTRSQYGDFLNQRFKPEEIKVQSTQSNRTIMSAQCFLAGLYPPKDTQVWHPIPVHVLDYKVNSYVYNASVAVFATCPPSIQEDKLYQQYKDLIDVLQKATNISYTKCMDFTFTMLLDMLITEKFYNLTLPFGLEDSYDEIRTLMDAVVVRWWTSPKLISGVNGPLFKDVIDALTMRSNKIIKQKAYAYFMHDANILMFLAAITNYPLTHPPFAASIAIELHKTTKNSTDNFSVKVYYKNTPTSTREIQYIKGCGHICPLKDFIELLRQVMVPPSSLKCSCI